MSEVPLYSAGGVLGLPYGPKALVDPKGNILKGFKDSDLNAKARIWPNFLVCAIFARLQLVFSLARPLHLSPTHSHPCTLNAPDTGVPCSEETAPP